jgi:hypothetical protein
MKLLSIDCENANGKSDQLLERLNEMGRRNAEAYERLERERHPKIPEDSMIDRIGVETEKEIESMNNDEEKHQKIRDYQVDQTQSNR